MDLSFSAEEQEFAAEVRAWLAANLGDVPTFATFDDEVEWGREWQGRLAAEGWVGIHWPAEYGGRGASPVQVALFNAEYARARAPQLINRVGLNLAGPTLLAHGTPEQKERWLAKILTAEEIWCQLFSEPGAGSDLASLTTRAEPARDGWLLSGQKVWTSYAQYARWGICLARTDPDAPKHKGISYLVVDMQADGIDVRPLRQITGEAEFNEVFLDEVYVPADHLVGDLNQGWSVANTTLAHERGTNFPFKEQVVHEVYLAELWAEAARRGKLDDPPVVDELAQAYVELAVLRLHNWRTLSRLARGEEPGPESSWVKLAWTDLTQHLSEAALDVVDPESPLWGKWQRQWLWSKAASIAGGTSEVQRTIIGDRILGLPR
ncbi:MAG: acyl-CoA dehydrogenase family protein [Acidimicrobiia bacterium]|nr:acyl-CoA dehydrogenase family protein [Acidimicrobiia bacterium]MBV9043390.1 acyl-CoA dehydrogenase family protein [Acidimicrobiia bacterium]